MRCARRLKEFRDAQIFRISFSNLRRRPAKLYQSDEIKGRVDDRLVVFDFWRINSGTKVAAFRSLSKEILKYESD